MPHAPAPAGPLCLKVELTLRAGGETAALDHLRALAAASRLEPGCLAYNVHRAQHDPARVLIYEIYRDAAALDAHRASPHFARHATDGLYPLVEARQADLFDTLTAE